MTVLGLLIDDGVQDRGHRKTIFNPTYQFLGCKSEIQGEKVVTVFNITENKLALRNDPNGDSSSNSFGVKSFNNSFKSPSKNFENSNLDDNRFCQTDFNLKKSPLSNQMSEKTKAFYEQNPNLRPPTTNRGKLNTPEKSKNELDNRSMKSS